MSFFQIHVNIWFQYLFYYYFQAKRMDVVWGETAGVDGQLWLLCPILFILQVMSAKLGHYLLNIYRSMLLKLFSYCVILYIKLARILG